MSDLERNFDNFYFENKFIRAWEFSGNDNWRIYFNPDLKGNGFEFVVLEHIGKSFSSGEKFTEENWNSHSIVEILWSGIAFFDGIRHLYFKDGENLGYENYPDLDQLIEVLTELRKLEKIYCRDPLK